VTDVDSTTRRRDLVDALALVLIDVALAHAPIAPLSSPPRDLPSPAHRACMGSPPGIPTRRQKEAIDV
jgi:hypothetical protein